MGRTGGPATLPGGNRLPLGIASRQLPQGKIRLPPCSTAGPALALAEGMPLHPDDHAARLLALEVGVVALLHRLSRELADVRMTRGSDEATLQAEWTATELAALALHAVQACAATDRDQP